jgi:hypothetical protein
MHDPLRRYVDEAVREAERRAFDEVREEAERITARLLYSDEPEIDITLSIQALHRDVEQRWPDRVVWFEILYEARWDRLRAQGWAGPSPDD